MKKIFSAVPAIILALSTSSCCVFFPQNCACTLTPPPTAIGTDKENTVKVAASALTKSIANLDVEGSYKNVVNNTYATIGQDDMAFYLLLEAATCLADKGKKDQADKLIEMARVELANRHNAPTSTVTAHPSALTKTEAKVINNSPLKFELNRKFSTLMAR